MADKLERRSLIRMTYKRFHRPSTDLFFIIGKPETKYHERLVRFENETYGDLLVLPTKENMDNGKTYSYFKHIYDSGFPHGFFIKMDDDVYANISSIETRVDAFENDKFVYFGKWWQTGFMVGMGYGLSRALVEYIATDDLPRNKQEGQEDGVTSFWIHQFEESRGIKVNRVSWNEYYDHPQSGGGWAHAFTQDALLVHRCKEREKFIDSADFFLHDRKVKSEGDSLN